MCHLAEYHLSPHQVQRKGQPFQNNDIINMIFQENYNKNIYFEKDDKNVYIYI